MFSSKLQFLDELNDQDEVFERTEFSSTPSKSSQKNGNNEIHQSNYGNSQKQMSQQSQYNSGSHSIYKSQQSESHQNINFSASQHKDLFSQQKQERRQEAISRFMLNYENDLYFILNLPHTASKQEIKSQFRKLSLLYHPDKLQQIQNQQISQPEDINSKSNEQDFVKILSAYNVLSNDSLRQIYDEQGFQAVQNAMDKGGDTTYPS